MDSAFLVFGSAATDKLWTQVRDIDLIVPEFDNPATAFTTGITLTAYEELAAILRARAQQREPRPKKD